MADKGKKKAKSPKEKTDSKEETKKEKTDSKEETKKEKTEEKPKKSDDFEEKQPDDREMFKATCSDCGKETEVPFKPEEGREVFCKECYQKRRPPRRSFEGGGNRFGGGRDRQGGRPREMHKVTCSECGKDAEVPFKPDGRKPVLCKECFMKNKDTGITAS